MGNWTRRALRPTVVAAGAVGVCLIWAAYVSCRTVLTRRADEQEAVMRSIAHLGGRFSLDTEYLDPPAYGPPRWLQSLIGQRYFSNIISVNLGTTQITDETIASLARLKHLQSLGIWRTRIGDAALASLSRLSELETLDISQTEVTDHGLTQLHRLNSMRVLVVGGERLTDAGLEPLKRLSNLTLLCVVGNQFSQPARASLEKALPDATVVFVPLPQGAGNTAGQSVRRPARPPVRAATPREAVPPKQPPLRGQFT